MQPYQLSGPAVPLPKIVIGLTLRFDPYALRFGIKPFSSAKIAAASSFCFHDVSGCSTIAINALCRRFDIVPAWVAIHYYGVSERIQ